MMTILRNINYRTNENQLMDNLHQDEQQVILLSIFDIMKKYHGDTFINRKTKGAKWRRRIGNILFINVFCRCAEVSNSLSVTDLWNNSFNYIGRQQSFMLHVQVKI